MRICFNFVDVLAREAIIVLKETTKMTADDVGRSLDSSETQSSRDIKISSGIHIDKHNK